jgi:hypothetical protein
MEAKLEVSFLPSLSFSVLLCLLRYPAPPSFRLFICPVTKPARRLRLPQSNPPRSSIRPTPIKITELTVSLAPTICSPSRHSHDVKRFIHFGGLLVKERLVVACEGRPSRRRNRGYGAFLCSDTQRKERLLWITMAFDKQFEKASMLNSFRVPFSTPEFAHYILSILRVSPWRLRALCWVRRALGCDHCNASPSSVACVHPFYIHSCATPVRCILLLSGN